MQRSSSSEFGEEGEKANHTIVTLACLYECPRLHGLSSLTADLHGTSCPWGSPGMVGASIVWLLIVESCSIDGCFLFGLFFKSWRILGMLLASNRNEDTINPHMPFLHEHGVSLFRSTLWGVGFPGHVVGYPSLISGRTEKWFSRASVSFFIPTCRVDAQVSYMLPRMFWSVFLSYLSPCDECIRHLIVVDVNFPDRPWWEVLSLCWLHVSVPSCVTCPHKALPVLYMNSVVFFHWVLIFRWKFFVGYEICASFLLVHILYFITLINMWVEKCSWFSLSVFLIFGVMHNDFYL